MGSGKTRIKLLTAVIALTLMQLPAMAQSDPFLTQYWAVPTLLNPASTGDTDYIRIRGAARLQWIGIEHAPKSFIGAADSPFKLMNKRIGAGVTLSQESLGLFSNLLLSAQGSYKFKLFKGTLSAGIQIGYYNSKFRGSDVYIPDEGDYHQPTDPSIPTQDLTGNAFDLGAGIHYTHKLFYAGISGLHLTSPTVKLTKEGSESSDAQEYETKLPASIYFNAGSNIDLHNTLFTLQPSLILATDFSDFSAQLTMRASYNKFITFGIAYRWNDAVALMLGVEFKNFYIGYAYDYPVSAISRATAGSHELVAGYQLKLDLSGKNTHSHRSIRIM